MNWKLFFRFILDILILVSVIQGWWFVALPLSVIGLWYFPYFLECVAAGIMYDALFSPQSRIWILDSTGLIVALVLCLVAFLGRNRFR